MKWSDLVGDIAGMGLPLVGNILGGPLGGKVGSMLAGALGVKSDPASVKRALGGPGAAETIRKTMADRRYEVEALAVEMMTEQVRQTGLTSRAELVSGDKYVSRMRPTTGYVLCFVTVLLVATGCYALIFGRFLGQFVELVQALVIPLSAAYGVLGVYVHGRTKEKLSR